MNAYTTRNRQYLRSKAKQEEQRISAELVAYLSTELLRAASMGEFA